MNEYDVLLKIYIGQHIRPEGILQGEIREKEIVQSLLSKGLIKENRWYNWYLFLTTDKGTQIASTILKKRLEEKREELEIRLKKIPKRALTFIINKSNLVYSTEKPWSEEAEDKILSDSRIWILRDMIFTILCEMGFCVETYSYVSTRGGELRELCYVISPEIRSFILNNFSVTDFTSTERSILKLYSFLISISKILDSEDIEFIRQRFYELLKRYSLTEDQVAAFIQETSKKGITSDYRGLLSEDKPFDIKDPSRFNIYLDKAILEPAITRLLEKGGEITRYETKKKFPSLSETKAELGILDYDELGQFYVMISNFEKKLREFLKAKLGKGWLKILRKELPQVVNNWEELKRKDEKWGIEPEKDIMNYASCEDYIQIIRKFKKKFTDNDEDLAIIIAQLKIWYNQGRNPLMHCRTVNMQKFLTTKSAIEFLEQWIRRKS